MNWRFQGQNQTDGKADYRARFKAEYDRQFAELPTDAQDRIRQDPFCAEAEAILARVEREMSVDPAR